MGAASHRTPRCGCDRSVTPSPTPVDTERLTQNIWNKSGDPGRLRDADGRVVAETGGLSRKNGFRRRQMIIVLV
jgi:hypothetical protein